MEAKDLLNPEKMKELAEKTKQMETLANKEVIKQNKPKENFGDLQKLDQEGKQYEFKEEQF